MTRKYLQVYRDRCFTLYFPLPNYHDYHKVKVELSSSQVLQDPLQQFVFSLTTTLYTDNRLFR